MANIKKTIVFLVIYFVCVSSLPSTSEEDEDEDPVPESRDDDGRVYKNPRNSPSAQCPRDEEQATLLGQKCLRKCSSDEDCKSKKKRCLCDGACGMSCIKPDRECPELEQPDIGKVTLTGRLFGDKAVYSCPMGYHVVGLQSRSCQADGQWAGKTPACKENIYCLQPPTIEHARHSALPEQATFDLDATVQYHCHTGYVTNGFPRAKCLAIDGQASWYGPDISCEPRSCGEPGDVPHGWVTSDCHTFGCRAVVQCGPGFELVGKAERFCQADGAWAPKELPTCVLVTQVQCPPPEAPRHGKAVYTSFAYNSVVSYECKYGYRLVGDATRRCGADKKWSGSQPACKEINCGHPGQLWNGWLENISSGTGLGASLIFRCQDGMKMEGNGSAICQSDGTWSRPLPKCLAPCVVPHVSQGRVLLVNNKTSDNTTQEPNTQIIGSSSMVQHGEIITIDCEKNYEFPSNNPAVTCNNGTWTQVSRCQPARCKKAPKFPRNGMVIAPKTEHGMKARFRCKDGFKLRGNPIMVCSFGNWTGEAPKCEEVFCPFPGFVEHGNVLLVGNMGLYDYRPYVRKVVNNKQIMYECDKGYVFSEGPPGATCIGGHWSPRELPKCTLFQHPRLRWSRRRRSITEPEIRHVRSSYLRKYNTQLQRDHIEDVYKRYNGVTKNALRHANNKILKRLDIEEMAHGDDDFTEDNLPTAVYTIFNLNGDNLRHRILAYQPIYQTDDTNEDFEETNADDLPNITVMKGGVFPEHSTGLQETTSKVVPKLNIEAINNLKHDFFEMYFDKRSIRLRKHLEKTSTEETSTQKVINQELIGEETKTKTAINHEIKKRTKRSLDDNTNDLSVIPLKINKAKSENTIANKRNIIPTGDIGSAIMSLIDRGTKIDFLDKRDKRTSRKSDKLNQTTATVPKSGRNNKGTGKDSQESNESDEDNLFSDQESGNKDVLLEKGKKRPKSPCEPIESQPYVNIEVVKFGRDPNNTFSSGTIVRVACGKGYLLNLESNSTAKCIRGRWKPEKPICEIQPCHLPSIEYGTFTLATANISTTPGQMLLNEDKELNESDPVQNGQTVQFSCDYGYNVQGPNNLRCWLGEWTVTSMPECVPAHCELPSLFGASYESGYRAGLTISHASSVNVACDPGRHPPAALNCHLGRLQPTIQDFCKPSSNSTRTIPTSEYQSGSDIVRHDISELEPQSTGSSITECGPPTRVQGSLIYRDGTQVNGSLGIEGYPHGTEITFSCIASIMGEKTTWKVICEQGEWIGKSFDCEELVSKSEELQSNNSCKYNNDEPQVVSFYNDLEITETLDFLPGTVIVSRCSDIGKYVMSGSQYRTCSGGSWDGVKPSCVGLNQQKDYAMERPPTILFRHSGGPIAQTNDGKLVVYPGTTLHMECLWMRRFGNPKWNVTLNVPDPERKYVDGWSTDPGRDSALEYQLTIENADKLDSGIYKCETPARQIHQVEIIVNAIHCPLISPTNGLIPSTLSNQLGTEVSFTCSNGNALLGSQVITCKASGNWSAPVPVCESVECGDVPLPPSASPLRSPLVSIFSRVVGGRATFACPSGWTLQGPTQTVCQPNAHWTKPFPVCKEVSCPSLPAPSSGYVLGRAPFKAGDVLQFHCNPEHTLHGRPILVCQDSGRWSDKPPTCAQACTYPGTTISGRMSSVKFYYKIGETVTFTCEAGYKLKGAPMLRCLKNRKWSNAIPLCTPTNNSTYIDPSANYNSDIDAMLSDETSDELESGISNSDTEIGISNSDTRVSKFNIPATLSSNSIKAGLTRLATSRLLRRSPLDMYKMRVNRVNKLLRRDKER